MLADPACTTVLRGEHNLEAVVDPFFDITDPIVNYLSDTRP